MNPLLHAKEGKLQVKNIKSSAIKFHGILFTAANLNIFLYDYSAFSLRFTFTNKEF